MYSAATGCSTGVSAAWWTFRPKSDVSRCRGMMFVPRGASSLGSLMGSCDRVGGVGGVRGRLWFMNVRAVPWGEVVDTGGAGWMVGRCVLATCEADDMVVALTI